MVYLHQVKYQNLHQNRHSESLHNYGPSFFEDVNAGHWQKTKREDLKQQKCGTSDEL